MPSDEQDQRWWQRDEHWWSDAGDAVAAPGVDAAEDGARPIRVQAVDAAVLIDLRRAVLRDGRTDLVATLVDDDAPTSCHLAAVLIPGPRIVGCVSLVARESALAPLQLSLMAVDPAYQGQGVGAALVLLAQRLVASALPAYSVGIWANARDSALGFYERLGFEVVGDGFVSSMDLPHHRVRWRVQQKK